MSVVVDSGLAVVESEDFERLESVVEAGMQTFVEVGAALAEIRDRRLYRETHGTFEDYCQERWGMSRRNANRLVAAAEVVTGLGPTGPKPTSERQVRPLAKLPPEHQPKAWERAVENAGGQPTGEQVRQAVAEVGREVLGPAHIRRGVKPDKQAAKALEHFDRAFGSVVHACTASSNVFVPPLAVEDAERFAAELDQAVRSVHQFKRRIKEATS